MASGLGVLGSASAPPRLRDGRARRFDAKPHCPKRPLPPAATGNDDTQSIGDSSGAIEVKRRLEQIERARQEAGGGGGWQEVSGQRVRLPPGRAWGFLHFTGGAVLGSFPHIAYSVMLERLSDEQGLAIIATPYEVGTNHWRLAEQSEQGFQSAFREICQRESYSANSPCFGIGHSLGAKLQVLSACSHQAQGSTTLPIKRRHVLTGFNNASATDTVSLLERFARRLLRDDSMLGNLPRISSLVGAAVEAMGVEFSPTPSETLASAKRGFTNPDATLGLLQLSEDDLDMSEELAEAVGRNLRVVKERLPGSHVAPVCARVEDAGSINPRLSGLGELSFGDAEVAAQIASCIGRLVRAQGAPA